MERKGICCAGNWIIDNIKIVDTYPQEDNLANILEERIGTGGAPYNVLVDLARMDNGLYLEGIGVIGNDQRSRIILNDIKKYHIHPVNIVQTKDEPTAYTDVITVMSTGRRTFFHNRGANKLLDFNHFPFNRIRSLILHIGYALLLDNLDKPDAEYGTKMAKVLSTAQGYGMKTSLDIVSESDRSRFKKVVYPSLKHVDYLIINETETENLTDMELRNNKNELVFDNFKEAAKVLFKQGVKELVVIHMPEGSWLFDRKDQGFFQPSHLLPEGFIKGSVGAGDAFCAGILYGVLKGMNYQEMMKIATAAAALNLSSVSATDGIPSIKEIMDFTDKTPYTAKVSCGCL